MLHFFPETLLWCRGPTSDTQSYFSDPYLSLGSHQCPDLFFGDFSDFTFILFFLFTQDLIQEYILDEKYLVSFVLKINVEKQGSRASSNVLTCGRKVYYYLLLVNLAESRCLKIIGHVNKGWTVLFARNYWSWDRSQPHPWRKLTKEDIRQVFWRTPYFRKTLRILFERWLKHFEHFWIPISSRFHLWLVLCFFLPRGTVAGVY